MILSASVEIFGVSSMQDFLYCMLLDNFNCPKGLIIFIGICCLIKKTNAFSGLGSIFYKSGYCTGLSLCVVTKVGVWREVSIVPTVTDQAGCELAGAWGWGRGGGSSELTLSKQRRCILGSTWY